MFFGVAFKFHCSRHDKELIGFPAWTLVPDSKDPERFIISLSSFRCLEAESYSSPECIASWEYHLIPEKPEPVVSVEADTEENPDISDEEYKPDVLLDDFTHESDMMDTDDKGLDTAALP